MTERQKILERIHEALQIAAPRPGLHGNHVGIAVVIAGRPVGNARRWLPPGGNTVAEQFERFQAASIELRTDFRRVPDAAAALTLLRELAKAEGWRKVASHRGEWTDTACAGLSLPVLATDGGYDVNALESCDAGITSCDALIAQTGSVLLTNRSGGGRALSVLPPHHVVLASSSQMVPDLSIALMLVRERYAGNYPSMIAFVTGPSRTGDIERILVLGAHGPKKLTIICRED